VRCAAQATLAVVLALGRPSLWLFVLLAWLGGTGSAFFTPALDALTVEIAPPAAGSGEARPPAAGLLLLPGRGPQGGEGGQPRDHGDDHRDR
jgi:MFS family permease